MVISALDIVPSADTEAQGSMLHARIRGALMQGDVVTVSFRGINTATSSFVNACFVPLLDTMSFDEIKHRLRIVGSTRQINDMIKSRLARESGSPPRFLVA